MSNARLKKRRVRISGIYAYKSRQVASRRVIIRKQKNKTKKICRLAF